MRAMRPSAYGEPRRMKRNRPVGVDTLACRYERGRDLWTGRHLEGEDARHWLRCYFGLEESFGWCEKVARIVAVHDGKVVVQADDGGLCLVTRSPNGADPIISVVSASA